MNATTYGLDVAKRVFQLYWVDAQTGEIANRRFSRDDLIAFLAQRPAGRVALEACGSAHWWARKIQALGHEVVLLHAQFIRPFVQTNKTDAADARAIWTAVQQPGMRTVAAKTEDQQAMLSMHRMRSQLIKFRTMQVNQLRGFLYEFGVTFRTGRAAGLAEVRQRMAELGDTLPSCTNKYTQVSSLSFAGNASVKPDRHLARSGRDPVAQVAFGRSDLKRWPTRTVVFIAGHDINGPSMHSRYYICGQ